MDVCRCSTVLVRPTTEAGTQRMLRLTVSAAQRHSTLLPHQRQVNSESLNIIFYKSIPVITSQFSRIPDGAADDDLRMLGND